LRGETIVVTQSGLDFARDWTHVFDTARGIAAVLTAPSLKYDTYNLSSGASQSIREIIDVAASYLGRADFRVTDDFETVNINLISGKPRGPLAIERIRQDTGFVPTIDLRDGVRSFIDWWRENHLETAARIRGASAGLR
jgi:nucleoside-diphosphate-sugar epimerase